MKKLNEWFKAVLPQLVKRFVLSKKDVICAGMNKKLDLPILNEKEELQLIEGLFEGMVTALDNLEKK